MKESTIADIRKDYRMADLQESSVAADPIEQFRVWWSDALASDIDEVNAMTLSTVSGDGEPDARIVLLKGFDERGFVFFTNYESRKGLELQASPKACLVFFWKELERQVRITGDVVRLPEAESDQYFQSRPAGSRIGAWASPQSQVIENRDVLENNVRQLEEKFSDGMIPRPPHWGGYLVQAYRIEFWQGRSSRLHDRIQYRKQGDDWVRERLAP